MICIQRYLIMMVFAVAPLYAAAGKSTEHNIVRKVPLTWTAYPIELPRQEANKLPQHFWITATNEQELLKAHQEVVCHVAETAKTEKEKLGFFATFCPTINFGPEKNVFAALTTIASKKQLTVEYINYKLLRKRKEVDLLWDNQIFATITAPNQIILDNNDGIVRAWKLQHRPRTKTAYQ